MRSITYPILHKMHKEKGDYEAYFRSLGHKAILLSTHNPGNTDWFTNSGFMPGTRYWHFTPYVWIVCFRPYRFPSYPDYKLSVPNKTERYRHGLGDGEEERRTRVLSRKTISLAEYVSYYRVTIAVGITFDAGLFKRFLEWKYGSYSYLTRIGMIHTIGYPWKDMWLHEWYINPSPKLVYNGTIGRYTANIVKQLNEYRRIMLPKIYSMTPNVIAYPEAYGL